ncbi:MAG: HlyD family efflux transporter periplasmic adaptor subunit, partial [Pseudomonadota bacterium]
ARAALAAAEARLKEITLSNERLIVRAPQAAIVDALPYEVGERPPQGGTIAVLLADTAPYARVYIPEPLRVRVRPGSRALVYVDGREDPLPGTMRFVSSEAAFTPYYALTQRDRSRLSFLAEVEVTDPRARDLPVGVPVEVELIEVGRE